MEMFRRARPSTARSMSSIVNGAMTAEWSLDVEKASNDGVRMVTAHLLPTV